MPRATIKKHRGDELPCVSIVDSAITKREIIAHKAGLERIEKELRDETRNVQSD